MSWQKFFEFYSDVPQHVKDAFDGSWVDACKVFHAEKIGSREKEAAFVACLHTYGHPFQRMPMLPIAYFEELGQ